MKYAPLHPQIDHNKKFLSMVRLNLMLNDGGV